ncbi:hypothetical protein [Duganella sp. Dugasp56]|uniref:hypothetical protein n=1 Tax=Duganella sp. Dugasp56 TaxID=3243046 RepID=UPI0039B0B24F
MNDNELNGRQAGRQAEDAYWNEHRHYIALATELGNILCGILSDDLRAHLLLILIRQRQQDSPAHIHALLVELLGGIQNRINMNRNKRAAAQPDP